MSNMETRYEPDSLCAQVLKARYYPDGSLEDTAFLGECNIVLASDHLWIGPPTEGARLEGW